MGEPLPFGAAQKSGFDPETGAGVAAFNVYTDARGAIHRRPGIGTYSGAPSAALSAAGATPEIRGLFFTDDGVLLAVAGGAHQTDLLRVDAGGTNFVLRGASGSLRPSFVQTEMLVVLATGNSPIKYERASGTAALLGGTPPRASHLAVGAQRILANDLQTLKSSVYFSATAQGNVTYAGHEQWTLTNPVTSGVVGAEKRPDPVVAIADGTNEVFAWGTKSLQLFAPDPQFGFAPTSTIEYGLLAPYSVIKADDQFFWLDQYRRFVISDGRGVDTISADIEGQLDGLSQMERCFGYRVAAGNLDALVWTFPAARLTFAYQKSIGWSQWSSNGLAQFLVNAHTYRAGEGTNIVATSTGHVGQLSLSTTTDLGEPILASALTGYLDRGTDARKITKVVRLALRRGRFTGSSGPQAFLSFRDRPGPWQARIPVDLGGSKDTEIVVELRSLGVYRRRQWMFEFSGTEDLVLAKATEEFEVLGQ